MLHMLWLCIKTINDYSIKLTLLPVQHDKLFNLFLITITLCDSNINHLKVATVAVIIIIILLIGEFFTTLLADGSPLESEWQQVSRTLLSILVNLNNTVVWMVCTQPLISKSSSLCTNPLVTVPSMPITTGMFHSFFNPLAKSRHLSLYLLSFSFTLWSIGMVKSTIQQDFFFFNYH